MEQALSETEPQVHEAILVFPCGGNRKIGLPRNHTFVAYNGEITLSGNFQSDLSLGVINWNPLHRKVMLEQFGKDLTWSLDQGTSAIRTCDEREVLSRSANQMFDGKLVVLIWSHTYCDLCV